MATPGCPLRLLWVLLLVCCRPASLAPTTTSTTSVSEETEPTQQQPHHPHRPTSQPSWHLLLALWRPRETESPFHGATATPEVLSEADQGTSNRHNIHTTATYPQTDVHPSMVSSSTTVQDTKAAYVQPIRRNPPLSFLPHTTRDEARQGGDDSPPKTQSNEESKWPVPAVHMVNKPSTTTPTSNINSPLQGDRSTQTYTDHEETQSQTLPHTPSGSMSAGRPHGTNKPTISNNQQLKDGSLLHSSADNTTQAVAPTRSVATSTTLKNHHVEVAVPAMFSREVVREVILSESRPPTTPSDETMDATIRSELDDHFFVHPLPHHRDVVHNSEVQENIGERKNDHEIQQNNVTVDNHEAGSERSKVLPVPDENQDHTEAMLFQQQEIQQNKGETSNTSETMQKKANTRAPSPNIARENSNSSHSKKGTKVLEFHGPVVMDTLGEPSLVPLIGKSKEILTLKDDEDTVLALLKAAQSSEHIEDPFQVNSMMETDQHQATLGFHRDSTQLPNSNTKNNPRLVDHVPLVAGSARGREKLTVIIKKTAKSFSNNRKSVNALDTKDKGIDEVTRTTEANVLPESITTMKPIYEEISDSLKVDTSIDDVEDFDIQIKHTEETDVFLPQANQSHVNLIDVSLHNADATTVTTTAKPLITSQATTTSSTTSTPTTTSRYPFKAWVDTGTNGTAEEDRWSHFIANFSEMNNASLDLNDSIFQKRMEMTLEEHYRMVLQERGSLMLQLMDPSADPCDDFYQFACGRWNGKFPIRQDKAVDNTFERLKEDLDDVLRSLLEEPPLSTDNNVTSAVKTLYQGCMNTDAIEALGAQPLLQLLRELGGWPVLEGTDWNTTGYDWVQQMAKLRNYNNDILISEWVAADITNSSNHIIQLDQPELGLPGREYFINPGDYLYREAYLNLMLSVTQLLGAPLSTALQDMTEVLHFEKQVSRILTAAEERRNLSAVHRRMTMTELVAEVPEVDWAGYLDVITWTNNHTEEVVVFGLDYFKKLVALIRDTDQRTISNYLLWRFVKNRISNLGEHYTEIKQKYIKVLFGRQSQPERWRSCVTYVSGNLGYVVGAMFVKRYFPEASKNDTDEMIQLIRQSFREALQDSHWMDPETRSVAQEKVDTIVKNVGYPEYLLNDTYMDQVYAELSFDPNTHFENVLKMLQFHARTNHNLLSVPVNRTAWVTSPAVVNAYYSRSKNMIVFPAGILQPPFYHPAFPRSLNYGGIGVVIGHEITHGFDDRGRQFDKNGNLQQWWKPEDVSKFYQRASCMLDQYGEYRVDEVGLNINPVNTLGENIADNAGIKISYQAYKTWRRSHEEEVTVPYVNLTHDQLFFLNFGQIWCEINSPEAMLTKIRSGQHSPNKFRVIGTLSNSEEFSEAFNCPAGSRMNPERKCRVW